MPRFTFRQEIAVGFAALVCSAISVISAIGPATHGSLSTFI
ncbi:hypothetical protein [Sphingorhabdus sp. SMR4y]|nr:hypothetical protein [Sphingorhabdus sp. SMR4y]ASK88997.1 hypothetical protein SPHFLASMR4Y_02254 [Sphingorhabdus sp. SMR4y]